MSTILLIILVLLLVGALPSWPYSRGWGYYPSGGLGLVVVVLLVLLLAGRLLFDVSWHYAKTIFGLTPCCCARTGMRVVGPLSPCCGVELYLFHMRRFYRHLR
jgi:hypothetical protein